MTEKTHTQHTPGPWEARCDEDRPYGYVWAPGRETAICKMEGNGQGLREIMLNARLIALAPEMLDALRDTAPMHDVGPLDEAVDLLADYHPETANALLDISERLRSLLSKAQARKGE